MRAAGGNPSVRSLFSVPNPRRKISRGDEPGIAGDQAGFAEPSLAQAEAGKAISLSVKVISASTAAMQPQPSGV
jgi:hypothetical protein